jgi:ParB family chromosome partitioning protein
MLHPEGGPMGTYECGKLYNIALNDLTPNPGQPRKAFPGAEIHVLADSIKEKGLLQPILVKELDDGQIIIVSGERRFRAHQLLERDTIPAWFTTGDAEELALVENLVREDLTAIETAEALKQLGDRLSDKPQANLARLIGKAESTVSEIMSLNKLTEDIRDIARGDKRFALRELKKIASKRKPEKQQELFAKYQAKIEAASTGKQPRTRSQGAALHQKKISAMQKYFMTMTADDKIDELIDLQDELAKLQNNIKTILHNLRNLSQ